MKRLISVAIAVVLALSLFSGTGQADVAQFAINVTSMDHYRYYYWELSDLAIGNALASRPDNIIEDIKITFSNINDGVNNDFNNFLWISFADGRPTAGGTKYGATSYAYVDTDFNGTVPQVTTYPKNNVLSRLSGTRDYSFGGANSTPDPNAGSYFWRDKKPGWNGDKETFTISLKDNLMLAQADLGWDMGTVTNLLRDGKIWIGMDADCHYYFDNIYGAIHYTNKVPEPGSLMLFGTGLIGLGFFSISRKKID